MIDAQSTEKAAPPTASAHDYGHVTPLEWAEYEFSSIEYDHRIDPAAAAAIRAIFKRLAGED